MAVRPVANTDLTVVLYPNPATTFLNLEVVGRNTGKMIISIVDMLGHTLQLISVPELQSKMQLDVSKLPSGIYALAVLDQSNQGVFNQTFKIIH
ncbi:MAG: T9SS type A sorting domain-containing protein [Bacteroidetes bacterium]|nr:T9SS type A sorting domain-containing protein [Bacteroidota bacterium]